MLRFRQLGSMFALAVLAFAGAGKAGETISYGYDELGRLVKVARAGTANNGISASYQYDPTDNRSNVSVSSPGAPVSFAIDDVSVNEGANAVFTVTKTGAATGTITVNYATMNGTAKSPADFTPASGTLTFLQSDITKTITVPVIDDASAEGAETFNVNLSSPSAGTLSDGSGTATIAASDSLPSFRVNDATVVEGGSLVFTVTKSGSGAASLTYATGNGTAQAGSDYTAASGILTFTSAQSSQTVSVATADDAAAESSETMLVNLSSPNGATLADGQGVGTITDNDLPPPSFSIQATTTPVVEGGNLVFTITKTGTTSQSWSVTYAPAGGTAVADQDYTSASANGTMTFASGETSKTITVATINDALPESAETLVMGIAPVPQQPATIGTAQATGTINDDGDVTYQISTAATAVEGTPLLFTVTKTGAAAGSVQYSTSDVTAVAPGDYTAVTLGTVSFAAADTQKTVSITTIDDTVVETDETMRVTFSSPSPGTIVGSSLATGTITSNDTGNTPPTAVADYATVASFGTVTTNVVANDTDADGDYPLTVTAVTQNNRGTATIVNGTSIQFTHTNPDLCGSPTVTYTVRDSRGATSTGTLQITVTGCSFGNGLASPPPADGSVDGGQ